MGSICYLFGFYCHLVPTNILPLLMIQLLLCSSRPPYSS